MDTTAETTGGMGDASFPDMEETALASQNAAGSTEAKMNPYAQQKGQILEAASGGQQGGAQPEVQEVQAALIPSAPHPYAADFQRRHEELTAMTPSLPKGKVVVGGVSAGEKNWWRLRGVNRGIRPWVVDLAASNGYKITSEQVRWLEQQDLDRPNKLVDYFSYALGVDAATQQGFGIAFMNKMRAEAVRLTDLNEKEAREERDDKKVRSSSGAGEKQKRQESFPREWFTEDHWGVYVNLALGKVPIWDRAQALHDERMALVEDWKISRTGQTGVDNYILSGNPIDVANRQKIAHAGTEHQQESFKNILRALQLDIDSFKLKEAYERGEIQALFGVLTELRCKRENATNEQKAQIELEYNNDLLLMLALKNDWITPIIPESNSIAERDWNNLTTKDHVHLIMRAIEVRAYIAAATLMLRFWHNLATQKVETPSNHELKLWICEIQKQELVIPENVERVTATELQKLQKQLGILARIPGNASKEYVKIFLREILAIAEKNNVPPGLKGASQNVEETYALAEKFMKDNQVFQALNCPLAVKFLIALLVKEGFSGLLDKTVQMNAVLQFAQRSAPFVLVQDIANAVSHWDFGLLSVQEILEKILE
eukprot:gb/GEZN01001130.1/.p1 GENE.gb/GEZN01001130.1/~~gb/GEZN01001130.1/.p1  ORF type:complete len:602 (+),score=85.58 gb/GEZN01001130.1/:27-1832(+)